MANVNVPYDRIAGGRLLTVAQVAGILACSRRWIYCLIEDGRLSAIRIGSRNGLRVTEKSLQRFIR